MAQIKVTHNKTARRFVVPETTTWADFERQLRSLFSIPSETTFAVSYTDEDGDVITLSSDLELRELLGQQRAGAGPIRLRVVTEEDSNEESWVAESVTDDAESLYPQGEESKESEENVTEDVIADVNTQQTDETDETAHLTREEQQQEERPRSYPSVTVVDEEDDPMFEPTSTYSSAEKGKQKEDAQKEDAQKEDDESEQRPPFLNLAQDFEVLLDRYHDVISRTPLLVDAANKVMDKILHGAKVDLDAMQAFFESFRRPTDGQGRADSTNAASSETQKDNDNDKDDDEDDDDNGYRRVYVYIRRPNNNLCFTPSFVRHPYWNNPFGNGIFHFYGPRYVNPSFVSPRFVNPFSTPVFGPRIAARPCGMRSAAACCPCPNAGYRMRFACAPSSFRTCAPSSNTCANRCARTCQRSGGQQASDAYADKIKQLESMGFTNRAEVEDLLRRYNGRMSRVVEILVRQRNGSHQTSSTTTRKIPIVDASAASSPSSSSDVTDVTATPVTDSAKEERVSFAKDVSNSNSDIVQKDETSKFSQSAATLVNVDANGQVLPYSL